MRFLALCAALIAAPAYAETHWRLHVLFSTPDRPEPHVPEGWASAPAASGPACAEMAMNVRLYLDSTTDGIPRGARYTVFCAEYTSDDYETALNAFLLSIGKAL